MDKRLLASAEEMSEKLDRAGMFRLGELQLGFHIIVRELSSSSVICLEQS
jgi:hypothetical protein